MDFVEIGLIERAYYSVFATNKRKTRFLNAYLLVSKTFSDGYLSFLKNGVFSSRHIKINTPKISLLLFFPMFVLLERFV